MEDRKRTLEKAHPKPWSDEEWNTYRKDFLNRIEKWSDKGYGECYLRDSNIRQIVCNAFEYFANQNEHAPASRYQLDCFVLMPNHAHLLVSPKAEWKLGQLIHSWKSFTAKEINKVLGKSGNVWMDERFDHLVRNEKSLEKFRKYIADNPGKAQLRADEFTLKIYHTEST